MSQVDAAQMQAVRRVLLSSDALCLSLGHFLELSFGAPHLRVQGRSLHGSLVRYLGTGVYLQMLGGMQSPSRTPNLCCCMLFLDISMISCMSLRSVDMH